MSRSTSSRDSDVALTSFARLLLAPFPSRASTTLSAVTGCFSATLCRIVLMTSRHTSNDVKTRDDVDCCTQLSHISVQLSGGKLSSKCFAIIHRRYTSCKCKPFRQAHSITCPTKHLLHAPVAVESVIQHGVELEQTGLFSEGHDGLSEEVVEPREQNTHSSLSVATCKKAEAAINYG